VAFSIVAGLPIVAKVGHNQLCVYMALLIIRLEHFAKRSKNAKNLLWISAPHRPGRNTSRQRSVVLEKEIRVFCSRHNIFKAVMMRDA